MAVELHFDDIDLLIIDPSHEVRRILRNMLADQGFRHISVGASLADLFTRMDASMPDLVISDDQLPDGDLCDVVKKLRHHEVGGNPFVSIIATTWQPTQEAVRRIVTTGADDILIKPISATSMVQHILEQVNHRKPFVVTSNYIGPDRRKPDNRPSDIPLFQVPNVLREKAVNFRTAAIKDVQKDIDAYIKIVNLEKLDRHADQLEWLMERILSELSIDAASQAARDLVAHMLAVAEDVSRRMVNTPYAHVSELCGSLIEVTKRILETDGPPAPKDAQLLKPLVEAIHKGFLESNAEVTATVHAITQSVKERHGKAPGT
ncbi:MAG: response regulator [Alphaproteobacteria bacterium]|nr:response regulator [Alphaproteobacteria bacterium]MBF0251394.1 response regulator [Alphaproteobacteria bacterium]